MCHVRAEIENVMKTHRQCKHDAYKAGVATGFTTVLSLILQLHGKILLCKISEVMRNSLILVSIVRKRSYILRKTVAS